MRPPTGTIKKFAENCEIKTIIVSRTAPLLVKGVKQRVIKAQIQVNTAIIYHFLKLRVRSVIGPHINRQRLAEAPTAIIPAVLATEKPFCVSKYGRVTAVNPKLIPAGSMRKKI